MITNLANLRVSLTKQSIQDKQFQFAADDPRRVQRISLEQQKKRAKERLRERRKSDPDCRLSEIQKEISKKFGFSKWEQLKAHIDAMNMANNAISSGKPVALDTEKKTLHLRCGSDIQHALAIAGFSGDFMVFPDPYIEGPLPVTTSLDEFIKVRAEFLSERHNVDNAYKQLKQDYADLDKAKSYRRVCLWFEHDSYDQLILAKLLAYFSDPANQPDQLCMISITHYPGVDIFNGLGQLPPEAMRVLWSQFTDVTEAQLRLGKDVWQALCAPGPEPVWNLVQTGTPALPTMAIALQRHLQQLPSFQNGLNLTEQLTLQILHDIGAMNAARLFGWYTNHYEPLTFMGDTSYWRVLEGLAEAPVPAITLKKTADEPRSWQVALTEPGLELLAGKEDWLELNNIQRWWGGVELVSGQTRLWCYDYKENTVKTIR